MKSGRQRRLEIKQHRQSKIDRARAAVLRQQTDRLRQDMVRALAGGAEPVDRAKLGRNPSYSEPGFMERGYYLDQPFRCQQCGAPQVWTAGQQKWWYETVQGDLWSIARLCRPCRIQERERRATARRVHLEGLARKAAARGVDAPS